MTYIQKKGGAQSVIKAEGGIIEYLRVTYPPPIRLHQQRPKPIHF